jgi:hypothetical protein
MMSGLVAWATTIPAGAAPRKAGDAPPALRPAPTVRQMPGTSDSARYAGDAVWEFSPGRWSVAPVDDSGLLDVALRGAERGSELRSPADAMSWGLRPGLSW